MAHRGKHDVYKKHHEASKKEERKQKTISLSLLGAQPIYNGISYIWLLIFD